MHMIRINTNTQGKNRRQHDYIYVIINGYYTRKWGVGEEGAQDKDDIHALIADAVVHLSGDVWLISSNP